ncbi:hypothetical protein RE9425_40510 [Prescottella equi]|nr:hypothetical protein RE9425_40510 [Prescottella equi]
MRAATLVMNGDSRLCATAKTMAARTNPVAVTCTSGSSHTAARIPIAADPRKIAVRMRKRIMFGAFRVDRGGAISGNRIGLGGV